MENVSTLDFGILSQEIGLKQRQCMADAQGVSEPPIAVPFWARWRFWEASPILAKLTKVR